MASLSIFDKMFLISSLALMWVAVVFWPASLSEKFTPLLTTTFASLMVIAVLLATLEDEGERKKA